MFYRIKYCGILFALLCLFVGCHKLKNVIPNSDDSTAQSSQSGKETYPFLYKLVCPEGYVNDETVEFSLVLTPDMDNQTVEILFNCLDGASIVGQINYEYNDLKEGTEFTQNIQAKLDESDKGAVECCIIVSDNHEVLYQIKKAAYIIRTDKGFLISNHESYSSLQLDYLEEQKDAGEISNKEYKDKKRELMNGGAKIESQIITPDE